VSYHELIGPTIRAVLELLREQKLQEALADIDAAVNRNDTADWECRQQAVAEHTRTLAILKLQRAQIVQEVEDLTTDLDPYTRERVLKGMTALIDRDIQRASRDRKRLSRAKAPQ
jgi:hypothetical protein